MGRSSIVWLFLAGLLAQGCSATSSLPSADPLPSDIKYEGLWDTNWGTLNLMQKGNHIHGRFKGFRNGSVSGDADGDLFVFRWTQTESRQWGRGYLKMTPDGARMEGRWGYQKNYVNGGRWWANRANR
jgi:hypothetical protein